MLREYLKNKTNDEEINNELINCIDPLHKLKIEEIAS